MQRMPVANSEDIWFKPIQESWNVYLLEDGTVLRIRYVLQKVVREKEYDKLGNPIYGFASQNVLSVKAPTELTGTPSLTPTTVEMIKEAETTEIKPKQTLVEDWNRYELDDGTTLQVKLVLLKVSRTNLHDEIGDPVYLTNSQNLVRPDIPERLRKKT